MKVINPDRQKVRLLNSKKECNFLFEHSQKKKNSKQ